MRELLDEPTLDTTAPVGVQLAELRRSRPQDKGDVEDDEKEHLCLMARSWTSTQAL